MFTFIRNVCILNAKDMYTKCKITKYAPLTLRPYGAMQICLLLLLLLLAFLHLTVSTLGDEDDR